MQPPGGASQFQCPGQDKAAGRYITLRAALFFCGQSDRNRLTIQLFSSNPRSLVICVPQGRQLNAPPNKPEETMTAEPMLTSDIIGLTGTAPLSRRGS
jgi:hypothetical protein